MVLPTKILASILFLVTFVYEVTGSYGIGNYGSEWMYFPDGDGVPHFINLQPKPNIIGISARIKPYVEFRLYTKRTQGDYIVINDLKTSECDLNNILPNAPLKIITHGWMSSADKSAVMNIVDAYLQAKEEVNIIALDWSSYSMNYFYSSVADDTKVVGRKVAEFLDLLHSQFNVSGNQIHLIGHSLGAHVMGIAGFESMGRIGRITGLDPALPMFNAIQDTKFRLDYNDATFVDIIHTCGGVLGFWDAIGKADFYPNSGVAPQPGCKGFSVFQFEACSHGRAIVYFAESILHPQAFPAYRCNMWDDDMEHNCPLVGFMGESANWDMSGIFYLQTNQEEPFGRGLNKNKMT